MATSIINDSDNLNIISGTFCQFGTKKPTIINYKLIISPDLQYAVSEVNQIVDGNVILWNLEINNVLYPQKIGWVGYIPDTFVFLEDYITENENLFGIKAKLLHSGEADLEISNLTNTRKFIRLIPDTAYPNRMTLTENTTASINNGIISFWLEVSP